MVCKLYGRFHDRRHQNTIRSLSNEVSLRACDCIFRESRDRTENSNFLLFRPKDPFGELFSKILFKSSSEFNFLQNQRKLEIPPDPARTPNNGGWNFCKIEQFQHASTES